MKAITVCQGWAEAIMTGGKDVENRKWETQYRGDIFIHAGKSTKFLKESQQAYQRMGLIFPDEIIFGALIGIVTIVDCVTDHPSRWARPDGYQFVLENPRKLASPIYCPGQIGIWAAPDIKVSQTREHVQLTLLQHI
jgi:hypothetical protein